MILAFPGGILLQAAHTGCCTLGQREYGGEDKNYFILMPTHETKGGGYQWGKSGKVYYGKGAKAKADRQGRAAYANGYRGKKK